MPTLQTMTLDEVDAALAALHARRKTLKATSKGAQRKIVTLAQRRERLIAQVQALEAQIALLQGAAPAPPPPAAPAGRPRRRQRSVTAGQEAIIACVARHGRVQRATIVAECQLSPATASAALRQLVAAGQLRRHGDRRATTYTLPD